MKINFDMDALRTMVVGTDLKSFARAAIQLGRSQSAVSMQLKKLEQQAGRSLFRRAGRGLVPTEAGEALLTYARRIIALNDEAVTSLGVVAEAAAVRLGLPQDFLDIVMPETIRRFAESRPGVHVEVQVGRNYALSEEVRAGRLDVVMTFTDPAADEGGEQLGSLPMIWLSGDVLTALPAEDRIPLVLYNHPCCFRLAAFQALESARLPWRLALETPSLPGVWAGVRAGQGVSVRIPYQIPPGVRDVGAEFHLPGLPKIGLRLISAEDLSPAASDLKNLLSAVVQGEIRSFL